MRTISNRFKFLPAVLLVCAATLFAGDDAPKPASLPEILPEGTIMLAEIKPWAQWSKDFANTSLAKVFAEPEVKAFLAGPFAHLSALVKRAAVAAPDQPKAGETAFTPVLEFLGAFTPGPFAVAARYSAEDAAAKRTPAVAILLGTAEGRNVEAVGEIVPTLLDNLLRTLKVESVCVTDYQNTKLTTVSVADGAARRTIAVLALAKGRLLISNETLLTQQIIDGMAGRLEKRLANSATYKSTGLTGDEHLVAYLDVAGLQAALGATEKEGGAGVRDRVAELFTIAGLNKSVAVAWSLRMNGPAFESRTAIFSKGEREGLLGALDEESLSDAALKICPKNTPLAAGFRVKPERVMPFVRSAVKAVHGQKGLDELKAATEQWSKELGRDLEAEVKAAFGNEFVITSLASLEHATPFGDISATIASLTVRDMKKADELLDQILTRVANRQDPEGKAANVLKEVEHEGKKIRYLSPIRIARVIEVSPAFVVSDNRLIVALDVPTLKRALAVLKENASLTDSDAFKAALAGTGGKMGSMFSYLDWAYAYQRTTNLVTNALRLIAPTDVLRQVGVDLNLVPTTAAVSQHLFPGLTVAQVTGNGVVVNSRSPLPSLEVMTPPLAAVSAVFASFRPLTLEVKR